MYKQIKIDITKPQLKKAISGKSVRISKNQIGSGTSYLSLHPANVRIVEKAAMRGAGCTICLAPGELMATAEDMGGNGIFGDIWKGLKSGYKWVKKNVIDTDIYQKGIKPLVREAVNTGVNVLKTRAPNLGSAIDLGVDQISKQTGAFGVRKNTRMSKAKKIEMLRGRGLYLSP